MSKRQLISDYELYYERKRRRTLAFTEETPHNTLPTELINTLCEQNATTENVQNDEEMMKLVTTITDFDSSHNMTRGSFDIKIVEVVSQRRPFQYIDILLRNFVE